MIGESNQEKEKQIMAKKKEDGHKAQKCGEEMLFSVNGDCLWQFYFILAVSCCALSVTT